MDLYWKEEKSGSNFTEGNKTLEIKWDYGLSNERVLQPLLSKNWSKAAAASQTPIRSGFGRAVEMTHWLRALTDLPENLGFIPSTHMVAQTITPVAKIQMLFQASTDRHTDKTPVYIK